MKNYLRLDDGFTLDDDMISGFLIAAREHGEKLTGRALAQRTFRQVMDSFPYYTDTIQSQLAYPPSYYSLPLYSTTLWNYSQMIKLAPAPVVSVQQMRYIDVNGNAQQLDVEDDYVLDVENEPARIFPVPGTYWPPSLYVANSLIIDFTAGYSPSPTAAPTTVPDTQMPPDEQPDQVIELAVPRSVIHAIVLLTSFWYDHRSEAAPSEIDNMFLEHSVADFQPTRG
jgi:hypothetical protein